MRLRRLVAVVAFLVTTLGVVLVLSTLLAPTATEKLFGNLKVTARHTWTTAIGGHVTVHLGPSGGEQLLDVCDGTFPRVLAYEEAGTLPTYAAHNNCQGDVILPLAVGDRLEIVGHGMFRVTQTRDVPKSSNSTEDLRGMDGELLLQTCYYGENRMKFLAVKQQ